MDAPDHRPADDLVVPDARPADVQGGAERLAVLAPPGAARPAGAPAPDDVVDTAPPSTAEHGGAPAEGAGAGDGPPHGDGGDGDGDDLPMPERWWERRGARVVAALSARTWPEAVTTFGVVVACVVFTFVELKPSLLFANTTPAGGDMGAHVWLPAFVKAHLIPSLRLTGWAPDWYAGFPALTYYFPLPMFAIAFVSYVVPYDIAFKLVSVAGLVTLPVAAWALGRLSRSRFPVPACLALASVAYLFSRDFTIYGGNIASTMAGEFSFSISLSLAVLFLGLVARGLRTGRGRAVAAAVLAACAVSHVLPLFFAAGGAAVMAAVEPGRRRSARFLVPVLVVAGLVVAVWALPFELRLPYATNMGYGKITTYLTTLFPKSDTWLFGLAAVGAALAFARRNRLGVWLAWMAVACAVVFRYAPDARLWNARVLPFWFLSLYLLVGVAAAELGTLAVRSARLRPLLRRSLLPVPLAFLLVTYVWVAYPLRQLPGGHTVAGGRWSWAGISSAAASYVPDWVSWNYSGYESPGKARRAEFFALIAKMRQLGNDPAYGCGRAMWEYEPSLDQMGTPDALMLLPYFTHGCIGSMEGLYYESSATTPYHFLDAAELSDQPSDPMRGLQYPSSPNVPLGVQHLQMLGVKWFMAITPDIEQAADVDPSLRLAATVGPFPVSETTNNQTSTVQRTWKIYEVLDAPMVSPMVDQPVVATGFGDPGAGWLKLSQAWYLDPSRWDVVETASGPRSWARVPASDTTPPRVPLPPVQVSAVRQGTDTISFDVDRPGVPVLVRTSYFPNWQASGAGQVYRATPNLMVVVPDATHVTLHYGYTSVDWAGFVMTLVGLGGLVVLARPQLLDVARRRRPAPRHAAGAAAGA
ncbi:MAG TPA: hypothetical protein VFP61_06065 [Acidimicrobiales bacterium]|nr:hypothetical protein [Acidimicrobiales bacterium]